MKLAPTPIRSPRFAAGAVTLPSEMNVRLSQFAKNPAPSPDMTYAWRMGRREGVILGMLLALQNPMTPQQRVQFIKQTFEAAPPASWMQLKTLEMAKSFFNRQMRTDLLKHMESQAQDPLVKQQIQQALKKA